MGFKSTITTLFDSDKSGKIDTPQEYTRLALATGSAILITRMVWKKKAKQWFKSGVAKGRRAASRGRKFYSNTRSRFTRRK